jgi:aquaporin Z
MNKALAEFIGTFTLVFFGCGAAVIAGPAVGATTVGVLGIAFAFGLAIVAMAYAIGAISGCHVNPAVSLGVLVAGKMSVGDFVLYVIAQCLGAIVATAVLYLIMSGKGAGWDGGLGANGWGEGYMGGYNTLSAFVFEAVATFIFLVAILGVTRPGTPTHIAGFAGLAIGLTLTLIHIVGINVTGVSVNPARSLGPALFTGGSALAQLWLFIVAPAVGAIVAGAVSRSGALWGEGR